MYYYGKVLIRRPSLDLKFFHLVYTKDIRLNCIKCRDIFSNSKSIRVILLVLYRRKIQFLADTKQLRKITLHKKCIKLQKKNVIVLKYIKNVLDFMHREFTVLTYTYIFRATQVFSIIMKFRFSMSLLWSL